MALIVQKYGGTSVGDIEKIRTVARRVINSYKQGNQMVVVLSAMAGQTDRLIKLAHELCDQPDPRELDVLMSTGEQVSIALFAMAVKSMGYDASSLLGFQVPIHTDGLYGKARIHEVNTNRIRRELEKGRIVAVAGFVPCAESGTRTSVLSSPFALKKARTSSMPVHSPCAPAIGHKVKAFMPVVSFRSSSSS